MSAKETISLVLQVLKEPKVIATVVVMILVVEFAKFIVTYKKKPTKSLKSGSKIPKSKKEPEKSEESNNSENSAE